ncbi:hypothetical protein ACS0TY_034082 [Phlomoides rotata]
MEGDNSIMYRECLRNHAASLGSYATDGCGEFIPDDSTFNCAACSCHRNFHRKVSEEEEEEEVRVRVKPETSSSKKRYRTKFTEEQKEEMMGFADKLGWRMVQRRSDHDEIDNFCRGVGISRKVFKVWMHNHKNTSQSHSAANANASSLTHHHYNS